MIEDTTFSDSSSSVQAIKADGSDIWALSKDTTRDPLTIEKISSKEKAKPTVNLGTSESSTVFEIKGNHVYLPIFGESGRDIIQGIKRMTFDPRKGSDGPSAEQTGYVDISPTRLGLSQDTRLAIRDMLIQQGKLYVLVSEAYSTEGNDIAVCRGGVIRIPLSYFDESGNTAENWTSGVKILGLSPRKDAEQKSKGYFYAPARFIARRPDELVIADDGFYVAEESGNKKAKNAKQVVFLDLDKFSMDVVDGVEPDQ